MFKQNTKIQNKYDSNALTFITLELAKKENQNYNWRLF